MRAISLPTARPIAAAAFALVAAVPAPLAAPSAALAERWLRPVPGDLARSFSYARDAPFAAGAHRGADLAAAPGTAVRAACAGRVIHAGAVAGRDKVVSMSCGGRRVSYLPLATVAVRAGATIRAGAPVGSVAHGHGGLHLGVRHEDDPFGYEDPMALLPARERPFAPVPGISRPRPATRPAVPRSAVPRLAVPRPAGPHAATRPAVPRPAVPRPVARPAVPRPAVPRLTAPGPTSKEPRARQPSPAPWPVWAGLAAVLCGAAGSTTVTLRRRRIVHTRGRAPAAPGSA